MTKKLSKKKIALLAVLAFAVLLMLTFIILFFCKVVNAITLCLVIVLALFLVSLVNLLTVSYHEEKKSFILDLVFTILIFLCAVSLIVLMCINFNAFQVN